MSPEAQRIAIAEACGWKRVGFYRRGGLRGVPSTPGNNGMLWTLPDYLGDLNAMHEAEERCLVTVSLVTQYGIYLANAVFENIKDNPRVQDTPWRVPAVGNCGWFATASQRAEAFLRTLNLWQE